VASTGRFTDAPSPNNGFALIWSHVFLMTGAQGYGVPESDLGVVVVLRHSAIPIAFRDSAWENTGSANISRSTIPRRRPRHCAILSRTLDRATCLCLKPHWKNSWREE